MKKEHPLGTLPGDLKANFVGSKISLRDISYSISPCGMKKEHPWGTLPGDLKANFVGSKISLRDISYSISPCGMKKEHPLGTLPRRPQSQLCWLQNIASRYFLFHFTLWHEKRAPFGYSSPATSKPTLLAPKYRFAIFLIPFHLVA